MTLTKRRDFLAAAKAARHVTPGMVVQARSRGDAHPPRVGFTCSRKIGNAVLRNRAKRRLRAVARSVLPKNAQHGMDYVLIGRAGVTITRSFAQLEDDLRAALKKLARR